MLSGILVIYENMACFIQATVCVQTSNWILRHQFKEEIISTQPFVTQANQQLEANLFFFCSFYSVWKFVDCRFWSGRLSLHGLTSFNVEPYSLQWCSSLQTSDIHLPLIHHTRVHLMPGGFVCVRQNISILTAKELTCIVHTSFIWQCVSARMLFECVCKDKRALTTFSTQQIKIRDTLIVRIRSRDPIDL